MILDGKTIIEKGFVTFSDSVAVETEDQVQPNGVDLRVNKLYFLQGQTFVPRDGKVKFDGQATELAPKEGRFELRPQAGIYLVDFLEKVSVKDGWCANIITRSSLVRSGVDVITGLWDTGFEGQLGASLRLINPITIEWGARIAQIQFYKSEFNGHRYSGRYQGANSQTALAT